MAYTQNTPLATDAINATQPIILGNFQALNPPGLGYMAYTLQGTAPTFASNVNYLYTFYNSDTKKNELYIKKPSNDAPTEIPMSASKMSKETMANSVNGWCYLPSGLLMKWGSVPITVNSTYTTVTFATTCGGPAFTKVFQVTATGYYTNTGTYAPAVATTGNLTELTFQIALSTGASGGGMTGARFIAIGV